jgi:hypothetical protein
MAMTHSGSVPRSEREIAQMKWRWLWTPVNCFIGCGVRGRKRAARICAGDQANVGRDGGKIGCVSRAVVR